MKTYSLKDKEALEQISTLCPSFPDRLQDACARELDEDGVEVTIYIRRDDLEITEAYKPNKWNNFPDVRPPHGVVMRCERFVYPGEGRDDRYAASFDGEKWHSASGAECPAPDKFRSWE